jgi:hypothetical protein
MLRWFLVAACAAGLVAAPFAFGAPEANAHGRNYSPLCVVVQWSRAWLHFDYNRCYDCCCERPGGMWVYWGRAFRAGSQQGEFVRVWNLQTNGRIDYRSLRPAHEKYCVAAGI